jgi:tRNA pseudouridine synthase 10
MHLPEPAELLPAVLRIGERYEFDTFVIGVHLAGTVSPAEKTRITRPLKERLGRLLESRYWPGRRVEFDRPELQLHVDAATKRVSVIAAPIFVAGRYRKFSRRISSTHWRHLACRGKGCRGCNFRGYLAEGSVGEIIGQPLLAAARGSSYYLHGMGREDVDARMLGAGRPFVVEIAHPHRRRLDLAGLRQEIAATGTGKAEVAGPLVRVNDEMVPLVKNTEAEKSYCALVVSAAALPADTPLRVGSLGGQTIAQATPSRVRHRRSEKTRRRAIDSSLATLLDARSFLWQVRAGGGTYIKELASGDGGRTVPSLTEVLGTAVAVVDLDVVAVHWRAPWEPA